VNRDPGTRVNRCVHFASAVHIAYGRKFESAADAAIAVNLVETKPKEGKHGHVTKER